MSKELEEEQSALKNYIKKNLSELSQNLQTDEKLQNKIDRWIRVTAYKYILKNTHQFGDLISSTVGNWQGKELSEKLELEVGKRFTVYPRERNFGGWFGWIDYLYGCAFFYLDLHSQKKL